jgi:hypothetical protein
LYFTQTVGIDGQQIAGLGSTRGRPFRLGHRQLSGSRDRHYALFRFAKSDQLILCDALAQASTEKQELLIELATPTSTKGETRGTKLDAIV